MKRRISTQFAAGMAVLALTAFGCTTTSGDDADTDAVSEFTQADQDEVLADETTGSDMASLETIYFEFDRSTIGSDARPLLRGNGDKVRRTGGAVRLEGFCDERGDEEYNLALGERRANSVKQYLENLGVDSSQMRTLSYGEAKPAVAGHTEDAWRYNRRVEFHARK
ncbi:MAG: OmpA family protein [Myxococcota bacterium]